MIKLLFWNLAQNSIEKYIADIIIENNIDICVFAEYNMINFGVVLSKLGNCFNVFEGLGGCDKIILIARSSYDVEIRRIQNRYTIYYISNNTESFVIAGIHLQRIHIVKSINGQKLLKAIKPNSEISDHLPLIVEFERRS